MVIKASASQGVEGCRHGSIVYVPVLVSRGSQCQYLGKTEPKGGPLGEQSGWAGQDACCGLGQQVLAAPVPVFLRTSEQVCFRPPLLLLAGYIPIDVSYSLAGQRHPIGQEIDLG